MGVTEELILRIRAAGARRAARDVDSVGSAVDRTGKKTQAATTRAGRFDSVLKGANKRLSTVSRGLKGAGSAFSAVTFPILGAAFASGKLAIDFDRAMRNVNSIAQLPEKQLLNLRNHVLALAGPTAQAPQTLALGLYDLVSSGFSANQALKIIRESARAATAGLTDAATSTKVMAAVLNAYRLPATAAKKVSDELFQTVNLGVITFEELAQNIGDTLPFASSLGVSLTEVGAATATMTKQGLGAPETMTRIRNLLQTMIKPGDALTAAFKRLGVESGEQLIKQKGLQGALDALIGSTDGSKKAVAKLFPNIRALGGALALTGKNSEAANKDLKGMQGAGGATGRALSQQAKSASFQWQRFMANIKVLGIELANAFMPTLNDVTNWLGKVANAFRALEPGQKKAIVITLLVIGVLGPLLLLLGAIAAAGAALATTAGLVTVGIVALAAAVIYAYTKWGWFRDVVGVVWKLLKISPLGLVVTHLGDIVGAVVDVGKAFGKIPGMVKGAFVGMLNWVIGRFNDFISVVNAAIDHINKVSPFGDIGHVNPIGTVGGPAGPRGNIDYGGFNPLSGRPLTPPRPRSRARRPGLGGPTAGTSSVMGGGRRGDDRPIEVHTRIDLDGREVAKSVHRHSRKQRSVE